MIDTNQVDILPRNDPQTDIVPLSITGCNPVFLTTIRKSQCGTLAMSLFDQLIHTQHLLYELTEAMHTACVDVTICIHLILLKLCRPS